MNDLRALSHLDTPSMYLSDAVAKIFDPVEVDIGPHGPSVIALVGDEGMGKSVSLPHLGQLTARRSLEKNATAITIPVYLDLGTISPTLRLGSQEIQAMIEQAMQPFWKDVAGQPFADLLRAQSGPVLRSWWTAATACPTMSAAARGRR
jgi:ABC-type dipeptide/oligopeptide/nickel transport system ATPase component